jgi:ribonuclease P protein component
LNDENHPRLGLAVSRRVNKRAVVRNRIKRIVRERFRISKEALTGLDIVVVALQPAGSAGNGELVASIDRHWQALVEKVKKSGT